MTKTKAYESVWDAIEPDPVEAENLKLRSALIVALTRHIKSEGLTQAQAAKTFGVTQPRISHLIRGNFNFFGLDTLVKMASSAGLRVAMSIDEAARRNRAKREAFRRILNRQGGEAPSPEDAWDDSDSG